MPEPLATGVQQHNFPGSAAIAFDWQEKREPLPSSDDIVRLMQARVDAWNLWWHLYCESDVWTNPDKKRAMCLARLEYQDAFFALASALSQCQAR